MPNCIMCGAELIWQNDYDFEDYGIEGEGVVSTWDCPNCGAWHEVYSGERKTAEQESETV